MVSVTVVDNMDNSVVATTTVERGGDITDWLNSLTIPTHDGYEFDKWVITAGYIYSVNDNATVYIYYKESNTNTGGNTGNTQLVTTDINGDGDISLHIENLADEITGSATVQVYFTKSLNTVGYDSFDVMEWGAGIGAKTDASASANIITFTDDDCSTHDTYSFRFNDADGNKIGQTLWDDGLYVTKIKFTFSDNSYKVYDATKQD